MIDSFPKTPNPVPTPKTAYILTECGRPLAVYTNPDLAEQDMNICNEAQIREHGGYTDSPYTYEIMVCGFVEVR